MPAIVADDFLASPNARKCLRTRRRVRGGRALRSKGRCVARCRTLGAGAMFPRHLATRWRKHRKACQALDEIIWGVPHSTWAGPRRAAPAILIPLAALTTFGRHRRATSRERGRDRPEAIVPRDRLAVQKPGLGGGPAANTPLRCRSPPSVRTRSSISTGRARAAVPGVERCEKAAVPESPVHRVRVERLRIEVPGDPREHLVVLIVLRRREHPEQLVVSRQDRERQQDTRIEAVQPNFVYRD